MTGFEPGERKRNLPFAVGMFAPACFSFAAVLAAFQVIAIRAFQLNFRYAIWCGVIAIALFCLYRLISVRKLIHDPDRLGALQVVSGLIGAALLFYFVAMMYKSGVSAERLSTNEFVLGFFPIFNGLFCMLILVVGSMILALI